jgi:dephospho-CoA kinase
MLVVALTGGIGSGKSVVSRHLESLGVPLIDADILARRLVEPGSPALEAILETFGRHLADAQGRLDRSALRDIVFNDAEKRRRLESILHPRIREAMEAWVAEQTAPYVVLVIPLLFETGQSYLADRILVIDCDESIQIQRAALRDNIPIERARQIMITQADRQTRLAGADDVIENNGDLKSLLEATEAMHQRFLKLTAPNSTTPRTAPP